MSDGRKLRYSLELAGIKAGWVGMAEGASWSRRCSAALHLHRESLQGYPRPPVTSWLQVTKPSVQSLSSQTLTPVA